MIVKPHLCACHLGEIGTFPKITAHCQGDPAKHTNAHTHLLAHASVVSGSSTFTLAFGENYHLTQQGKTLYNPENRKGLFTMSLIIHLTSSKYALTLAATARDKGTRSFISNELWEMRSDRERSDSWRRDVGKLKTRENRAEFSCKQRSGEE